MSEGLGIMRFVNVCVGVNEIRIIWSGVITLFPNYSSTLNWQTSLAFFFFSYVLTIKQKELSYFFLQILLVNNPSICVRTVRHKIPFKCGWPHVSISVSLFSHSKKRWVKGRRRHRRNARATRATPVVRWSFRGISKLRTNRFFMGPCSVREYESELTYWLHFVYSGLTSDREFIWQEIYWK